MGQRNRPHGPFGTNETVEACLEARETLTDTGGNNVTV